MSLVRRLFIVPIVALLVLVVALVAPAGAAPEGFAASTSDEACPAEYPWGAPSHADVVFKSFVDRHGVTTPILLDVYETGPTFATQPRPAVVLVHGGGWSQGCKSLLNRAAVALAGDGFIVFAIDYRLTCRESNDPAPEELPLCGWNYPAIDPDTGTLGAAVHDVQDAIALGSDERWLPTARSTARWPLPAAAPGERWC